MSKQQSEKWLQKSIQYLTDCKYFIEASKSGFESNHLTDCKYFIEASKSGLIIAQEFEGPPQVCTSSQVQVVPHCLCPGYHVQSRSHQGIDYFPFWPNHQNGLVQNNCEEASGHSFDTASWTTNVGNEMGQLSFDECVDSKRWSWFGPNGKWYDETVFHGWYSSSRLEFQQLDPGHQLQFPVLITYQYACDVKVIRLLRQRSLGNSSTVLQKKLSEQHSEKWLQKSIQYLTECKFFAEASKSGLIIAKEFEEPPKFVPVPKYKWFLTVYVQDIMSRVDHIKASITSTFGRIIKLDSTKNIVKKLADTVLVLLHGRPTLEMRWVK
ncbi:Hypothetical predicted protein [Paramuricea clavata]|uniref:DUF6729 domain-containing protein n=1 Tax=Paramuricea clavata TaxID=317549 RepID=A0A6S7G9A4_PARCT|nr:Hypothetical predicted protein [Paramuricea clavata]